jgi:biopolymer transport protein ExbD
MLPLIDIVFLLLVFFIYAMLSMAVHHGKMVDLPVSENVALDVEEAISITIQDVGDGVFVLLDDEPVPVHMLTDRLHRFKLESARGKDPEVQIFADKSVSYQELFTVMDRVQAAGLTHISLQAEVRVSRP